MHRLFFRVLYLHTTRFSIYKHPHLMDLCREKGICLEMCPISYASPSFPL